LVQQGGADSVKLEGGRTVVPQIQALVDAGIPVVGHLGLTPQKAGTIGGFRVQGRDLDSARRIVADAEAIAEAGVFAIVLEMVPAELAAVITERVPVPTIGIGAGAGCDGQVLVSSDLLGMENRPSYRFVKRYAELGTAMTAAFGDYLNEVRSGTFPTADHAFSMKPETLQALRDELDS
jgi:3-methyl-2-oxobutanoate hydroxymethyltransferase